MYDCSDEEYGSYAGSESDGEMYEDTDPVGCDYEDCGFNDGCEDECQDQYPVEDNYTFADYECDQQDRNVQYDSDTDSDDDHFRQPHHNGFLSKHQQLHAQRMYEMQVHDQFRERQCHEQHWYNAQVREQQLRDRQIHEMQIHRHQQFLAQQSYMDHQQHFRELKLHEEERYYKGQLHKQRLIEAKGFFFFQNDQGWVLRPDCEYKLGLYGLTPRDREEKIRQLYGTYRSELNSLERQRMRHVSRQHQVRSPYRSELNTLKRQRVQHTSRQHLLRTQQLLQHEQHRVRQRRRSQRRHKQEHRRTLNARHVQRLREPKVKRSTILSRISTPIQSNLTMQRASSRSLTFSAKSGCVSQMHFACEMYFVCVV